MSTQEDTFDAVKSYLQQQRERDAPKPVNPNVFRLPCGAKNNFDVVYPGIYLGNKLYAKDVTKLVSMGVTHVVNCAQGTKINQINSDQEYFSESSTICFFGIPAMDTAGFNLSTFFEPAASFIHDALQVDGNKVYVHCVEGISRSATIVIAFLMLKRNMSLMEAVTAVRAKREVFPNNGFLKQLSTLEQTLSQT